MNTQSNAVPESLQAQQVAPATLPLTQALWWSVRRELWENRFVYVAPLVVVGIFLSGFIFSLAHLPAQIRAVPTADNKTAIHMDHGAGYSPMGLTSYDFAAGLMMATAILVSVFYCLDALHSERRDRSILFWKSLPVSDATTVLAKASIPFVVLPVLTTVIAAGAQLIMLLLSSVVLLLAGQSVSALWSQSPWFRMALLLFYHMVTAHALWPAPVYGWFIFVSGWARRAAFLWATLPVVAIAGLEGILFHSWRFLALVAYRLIGAGPRMSSAPADVFPTNPMTHITPAAFLGSPGLWLGLLVTAVFLALAVRMRKSAGPV
jgi:ABC-2 type transport system permease protein